MKVTKNTKLKLYISKIMPTISTRPKKHNDIGCEYHYNKNLF